MSLYFYTYILTVKKNRILLSSINIILKLLIIKFSNNSYYVIFYNAILLIYKYLYNIKTLIHFSIIPKLLCLNCIFL